MNDQSRQLVRAASGPVILITVGTLFALEKFTPYRFGQTWPVLLIIIGFLRLLGGGHPRPGKRYRPAQVPPVAPGRGVDPFPPIPQQPRATWNPAPPPSPPPPYSHPAEPMPDMTPPPPPRPGERR